MVKTLKNRLFPSALQGMKATFISSRRSFPCDFQLVQELNDEIITSLLRTSTQKYCPLFKMLLITFLTTA